MLSDAAAARDREQSLLIHHRCWLLCPGQGFSTSQGLDNDPKGSTKSRGDNWHQLMRHSSPNKHRPCLGQVAVDIMPSGADHFGVWGMKLRLNSNVLISPYRATADTQSIHTASARGHSTAAGWLVDRWLVRN